MKNALIWAGRIAAAIALIGLVVGWFIESDLKGKSGTYQLVKTSAEGALFGDAYENIGTPQTFVILDRGTLIEEPNAEGVKMLSEDKLKEKDLPPLQLKTVSFITGLTRLGFGALLVIGLGVSFWLSRKKPEPTPS
jgi:hypothetical protein